MIENKIIPSTSLVSDNLISDFFEELTEITAPIRQNIQFRVAEATRHAFRGKYDITENERRNGQYQGASHECNVKN